MKSKISNDGMRLVMVMTQHCSRLCSSYDVMKVLTPPHSTLAASLKVKVKVTVVVTPLLLSLLLSL